MGDNVISEIVSEKTAADIWSKLENQYLKKTLTNRLLLMQSCLFLKMKKGTTIKAHMTEFEDIIMKLKATDALLAKDEEALAMILLYSLPEKYSQFTNSFIYGRETLSLSDVKIGMISEDQRIQMRIGNNPRENNYSQGLFADKGRDDQHSSRGRNRGRSPSRRHGSRGKSKSIEKLMDMSSPTLDLRGGTSSMVDQTKSMDTCRDLGTKREEKLQFSKSSGSGRDHLEKEILCNLFTDAPERSEVGLRKNLPKREPRTQKYGVVTGPLEDSATELRAPIVKKEVNGDGNEQVEDNYETLRETAMEFWITMKKYYKAATDAYAKGSYELADKLFKEGHFFMAKAREANETSAEMLTQTRDDGEAISIDLTDYEPKEAIRLLKTQLKSMSGIPSIHYLKVMIGTEDDTSILKARKRLISKLLERDAITWTEEQDGQLMAIRIDVINPKRLSFNKK